MAVPFFVNSAQASGNFPTPLVPTNLRFFVNGVETTFAAEKMTDIKVKVPDSAPAQMNWIIRRPQHLIPIPMRALITLVDESYGGIGDPVFEGHVFEITPASNFEIHYTAYDPTARAAEDTQVQSGPESNVNRYPRGVWCVTEEGDDDLVFSRRENVELNQIITDVMTDDLIKLRAVEAAPPVGIPVEPADYAAMDYKPQEKMVFETEPISSAIDRLTSIYPGFGFIFHPGANNRKWRFYRKKDSPAVTLTLNDFQAQFPVVGMQLDRSLENRYTAVRFYGPEVITQDLVSTPSGLTELWNLTEENNFVAGGEGTLGSEKVAREWQITDPAKRRMGRFLTTPTLIPVLNGFGRGLLETRVPTLSASFDGGVTFEVATPIDFDVLTGTIKSQFHVYKIIDGVNTLPDVVRLIFTFYDKPITARFPAAGFSGSAFDDFALEREYQIYDEMLAIGYWRFRAVTTPERIAQFEKVAEAIHEGYKDVAYPGVIQFYGLDYRWLRLNRKVNIASQDPDGNPIVTGWENANAIVTDVEYDYSASHKGETTVTISGDMAEVLQTDPEQLKKLLGIRRTQLKGIVDTQLFASGQTITFAASVRALIIQEGPRGPEIIGEFDTGE